MPERQTLPVLALRAAVLFPGTVMPVAVGRKRTLRALDKAQTEDGRVFAVAQRNDIASPATSDLHEVGVIAKITQVQHGKEGVQVLLEGSARASVLEYRETEGYFEAVCKPLTDLPPLAGDDPAFLALDAELRERAAELAQRRGVPEPILARVVDAIADPGAFADLVAGHLELPAAEKQALLETTATEERMRKVLVHTQRLITQLSAREDIQSQVQQELGERQREMFLREQLRAIQKELGEAGDGDEVGELRERIAALPLPDEARQEVDRELARLERAGRESAEAQVIRTYLEWIVELPWGKRSEDHLDVARAAAVLDEDHYGLSDVKDRVLEFLAVRQLRAKKRSQPQEHQEAGAEGQSNGAGAEGQAQQHGQAESEAARGPILLFIGPPGVGKTSIGKSIARALGRKYARISLGGVRDEADIRGHRRTYVGAMPGRIVQALKQAGTQNPVILLDEVDKVGVSYQGNPAAALLEVLDPAQNHTFTDHYLNVPFDLSEVLFIATANFIQGIPAPLLDRMEEVEFTGYTEREKREIAKAYLLPRQIENAGLSAQELSFTDEAIADVIARYTREAGVRQLEQRVAALTRKLARKVAAGEEVAPEITPDEVRGLLGRPKVRPERVGEQNEVGVATGMYYTPAGGDIMFVEASLRRLHDFRGVDTGLQVGGWGNVSLILTGQLGDVMKESARAALTYAGTHAENLRIPEERVSSIEAHIHVPAGAIPKDGPSAGVAMATALVSAMSGRPVRRDVAMTGEATLRGRVLPIGGVKEKVLGAHRAGITHIILPEENEADLDDLPAEVRNQLTFSAVSSLDEVFELALVEPPSASPPAEDSEALH